MSATTKPPSGEASEPSEESGDGQSAGGEPEADQLSKSEIFDVLRNERRRYVLHYLERTDEGTVELGDLATTIAAWENGISVAEVSSNQRKNVYTTLQQSHLPRMDRAGVVEFDRKRGLVRASDEFADLTVYLEIVPGREFPWHEYYLGLGAVCCALMATLWAGIYPFKILEPVVWGTAISVVLILSASLHAVSQRGMNLDTDEELEIPDEG